MSLQSHGRPVPGSGESVDQRPAGTGWIRSRLGVNGGGPQPASWSQRALLFIHAPSLGGRRRRRGGTRVAEADRCLARGRCAGRISWVGPGTGQPPRSGATALGRAGLRRVEGNTVFGMFLYNLNCNLPNMH